MVLGITRERPRLGQRMALVAQPVAADVPPAARDWPAERGAIRWEGSVDLVGGFPGFAARGGRLDGATMRLTDRYLTVDEGRAHGFGLPIRWLTSASAFVSSDRGDVTLRLGYQDGTASRTFAVRFRGTLRPLRGGRRAGQALAALREVGLSPDEMPQPPGLPLRALGWEAFEQENVIWNGAVTAPIDAALSQERVACHVWLTTRYLLWGKPAGSTINRLPLSEIRNVVSAQLDNRAGTPVIYVSLLDEAGDRHDLPFFFNRQSPVERNVRERGAFLVGLRSRRLPLVAGAPLLQPWQSALPLEPRPAPVPIASRLEAAEPAKAVAVQNGHPQPAPAPVNIDEKLPDRVSTWHAWSVSRAKLAEHTASLPDRSAVAIAHNGTGRDPAASDPLASVRAYEAAALAMLTEATRAINDLEAGRRMAPRTASVPSPAEQTAALGNLVDLMASGIITGTEARLRKERLIALGAAGPRLRALIDLRSAGRLSPTDLTRKQTEITAPLSKVLIGTGRDEPPV